MTKNTGSNVAPKMIFETTTKYYPSYTIKREETELRAPFPRSTTLLPTTSIYQYDTGFKQSWGSANITTNKSYRQRLVTNEEVQPTESVKILPKNLEESDSNPSIKKQIRVQNERKRRKGTENQAEKMHATVYLHFIITVVIYGLLE